MKRKNLIILIVVLVVIVGLILSIQKDQALSGPNFIQQVTNSQKTPSPTPAPTPNAPKSFQFDSSTDLEAELQKINPEILDSDFE